MIRAKRIQGVFPDVDLMKLCEICRDRPFMEDKEIIEFLLQNSGIKEFLSFCKKKI